jgi:hypothetical protein
MTQHGLRPMPSGNVPSRTTCNITSTMRTILTLAFITVLGTAQAQTILDSTLQAMTKVQLSESYIEEVQRVTSKLIDTAWGDRSGTVPRSKYVDRKWSTVAKKETAYNMALQAELLDVIPYADKEALIKAIIYLRSL